MHMNFLIIQENKADNLFMLLDELFSAFQINFHYHKFFNDLQIFTFKNCMPGGGTQLFLGWVCATRVSKSRV